MTPKKFPNKKSFEADDSVVRRNCRRIRLLKDVRVNIDLDDDKVPAYMLDISKTGMKVKTDKIFTPGNIFKLVLSPKETIECEVKWVRKVSIKKDEYDIGLEFLTDFNADLDTMANFFDVEERREFKRKPPEKSLYIDICDSNEDGRLREVVKVVDISEGGVKIKLNRALTAGSTLSLKMPGDTLVYGEVRWSAKTNIYKENYSAGIEFVKNPSTKDVKKDRNENITERGERFAKSPAMVTYYNKLAISFRRANRFAEALYSYEKALKVDSDNEVLFFNMARVYIDLKNIPAAVKTLEDALKVDPDFIEAKSLLEELSR